MVEPKFEPICEVCFVFAQLAPRKENARQFRLSLLRETTHSVLPLLSLRQLHQKVN